ncbi:MAG: MlaD family protein [Acidobacteriota bacterium]|jgi:phospholipid/cholesterol/gamma-HCH transport system substrate-binding protein
MNRNLMVGLVISAAAAVLLITILLIGQDQALFTPKVEYTVLLPNAEGLQTGSPVKLVGVQIGVVKAISLPDMVGGQSLRVTLSVTRAYAERLRADTTAKLRVLTLLSGDRYIELTLGSPDQPVLPPGSELRAQSEYEELFTQGSSIANDLAAITATLRLVFDRIQRQEGVLGRLLMDPTFGQQSVEDFTATLGSLRRITGQVERGEGLAGALLSDTELRDEVTSKITSVLGRLDDVLDAAQDPKTPLGGLLQEGGDGAALMADLRETTQALRRVTRRLDEGNGLVGRLLSDPAYADRVLGDLERTLGHLASITRKIDGGQGSLGAFVNDPAVYLGIRDVVTGIQESRLLRWMVNRYAKKGAHARGADTPGAPAPGS